MGMGGSRLLEMNGWCMLTSVRGLALLPDPLSVHRINRTHGLTRYDHIHNCRSGSGMPLLN